MDRPWERLRLSATPHSLQAFLEFARAGASHAGLTPAEKDKLDLVLEELLVNVARYAYQPENGDVELAYAVDGAGALLVEISDNGRVFNPLDQAAPDLSGALADRPVGGLGLFLVRRLVGSFCYRRTEGRNTVSFRVPGGDEAGT
jgi:serine/threonine-protein kinase RsbW